MCIPPISCSPCCMPGIAPIPCSPCCMPGIAPIPCSPCSMPGIACCLCAPACAERRASRCFIADVAGEDFCARGARRERPFPREADAGDCCDAAAPPCCWCSMPGMYDMACPLAGNGSRWETAAAIAANAANAAWLCHPCAPKARCKANDSSKPIECLNNRDRLAPRGGRWSAPGRKRLRSELSSAPIHEGPGLWPFHITGFERVHSEAGGADQVVHIAIEMAAATDPLPAWRQPVLPADYPRFLRQPVLNEKETSARLQHALHLMQRGARVRDRAQGPGHHERIESGIPERQLLGRRSDKGYRDTRRPDPLP